jgi:hypothetical protein
VTGWKVARRAVTGLLILFALAAAILTLNRRIGQDLGPFLTLILTALALGAAQFDRWVDRNEAVEVRQDEAETERVRLLADRARIDVLGQVRRMWVRPELAGSLYQKAPIELRLVVRPEAVVDPLRDLLRSRRKPSPASASARSIVDVFESLGSQMLLLGRPGAGKTTLLMELTEKLLVDAEQSSRQPMPIVFHLAAWLVEERTLIAWLGDELHKRYGVPRRLAQTWLADDQIVPLLDGLDEVADKHRDSCVRAINGFHDDHGVQPMVVTSRVAEYDVLNTRLQLRGAVEIEPLSATEVNHYLHQAGQDFSGLRAAVRVDQELAMLLTAPLFLSLAVATYAGRSPASVRSSGSASERREGLLSDFVDVMLSRTRSAVRDPYPPSKTLHWLHWLATTMLAHGESLFYFDWIQATWLPKPRQRLLPGFAVAMLGATLAAILVGVLAGLAPSSRQPWVVRLFAGAITGVPIGLIVGALTYRSTIEPADALRWSRDEMRRNVSKWTLRGAIAFGLIFGFLGATVFGLVAASRLPVGKATLFAVVAGLIFGVPSALISGLLLALAAGLQPAGFVARPGPGIAIRRSMRNGVISGALASLVTAFMFGLVTWLVIWLVSGLLEGLNSGTLFSPTDVTISGTIGSTPVRFTVGLVAGIALGLPVGLIVGLVVGFQRGLGAYLRHTFTRWLLIIDGVTPRDYLGFLDYARRLTLLQPLGGGYQFIHPLLLDHFARASAGPDTDQRPPARPVLPSPRKPRSSSPIEL